ncbi:unnamed protein product [Owenia fusiformis]|uniref:G-protein coupled receptors family 3 profile domain-containing protein n=1 Tax=Owenia fusiformis TaxID=6347 RepID=A0A8S4Q2Q6_OWEFU|nr:unnamed protein product [Owenia fusiformis]
MLRMMLNRYQHLFICILIASGILDYVCQVNSQEDSSFKGRAVLEKGDLMLGALFPVHHSPNDAKNEYTRTCGGYWEQYGMHRIEAFLYILDEINNNQNILPNISLGVNLRDSCWYSPVALEQSIDYIKTSIANQENIRRSSEEADDPGSQKACASEATGEAIAALIGPGSSSITIQVQNLLSLFAIPQIGYSATSMSLSDKTLFRYFLRVAPSDVLQAQALVDIVQKFNWTYVSTIFTAGDYGQKGMEAFHKKLDTLDHICAATRKQIAENAGPDEFDDVIKALLLTHTARVVICFCQGTTITKLYEAAKRRNIEGLFLFIGSDGWNDRPDVVENIEELAAGGMSIRLSCPHTKWFDEHWLSLKPETNTRNPWFKGFWQEKFKCYLNGSDRDARYTTPCTGNEDLSQDFKPDAKIGFVVNAIYTAAYALHEMHQDLCNGTPGDLCPAMFPINGSTFKDYLMNVSFTTYANDKLSFDEFGDPPGRYDILNYQMFPGENGTKTYDYVQIGSWDSRNLTMDIDKIYWPKKGRGAIIESVCSQPCPKGQVKKIQQSRDHCCWLCSPCKENEILLDESTCQPCAKGWWPNAELTACIQIKIEYIKWTDTEAVVGVAISCVGLITTGFVTLTFVRHNNTPVVKASTRELMYFILVGIVMSYTVTFPLLAKPSLVTCYLTRILPGVGFALIYGALVTKTNRIARILSGSKKKIMTRKPRFMSASAQVVITCLIIGIECAIITVMLIIEPADSTKYYPTNTKVQLICNTSTYGMIVPLGFDLLLIVMCTLYAIKTRNLPENFNEAKFIGFTMYTTCIIWLAFVGIYFGSASQVITVCLAMSLSASVALVLLFFPKIYIIICKPEKNNRSAFTTSKEVRCHIGSQISQNRTSHSNSNDSIERYGNHHHKPPMYRQKNNLFTNWKRKSLTKSPNPQRGGNGASHVNANSTIRPRSLLRSDSIHVPDPSVSKHRESIPLRDTQMRRSLVELMNRKNHDYDYDPYMLEMDECVGTSSNLVPNGSAFKNKCYSQDSGCQTDDFLLQNIVPSLRKRLLGKKDSMEETMGELCAIINGPTRKSSKSSLNSGSSSGKSSHKSKDKVQVCSPAYEPKETDSLLHNEQSPESDKENAHYAVDLDSSSGGEEPTSDHGSKYEDIEDILVSACTNQGNQRSKIYYNSKMPLGTKRNMFKKTHNPDSTDTGGSSVDTVCSNLNIPTFQEDDIISYMKPGYQSYKRPSLANVEIKEESRCPSSADSAQSYKMDTLNIPNQGHTPTSECPTIETRISSACSHLSNSSSGSEGSGSKSGSASLEDVTGMPLLEDEEDSVEQFQTYLRTRGMELDLNAVQSSDV